MSDTVITAVLTEAQKHDTSDLIKIKQGWKVGPNTMKKHLTGLG